jgi:hypothetical protein
MTRSLVGWSCAFVVCLSACVTQTRPPSQLAEGCLVNTDCQAPLVCAFRRCHQQCTDDRDCTRPSRCVPADRPFNVCLLPQDVPDGGCRYNSQCPEGLVCNRDFECRSECLATIDCLPGQVCVERGCAFPDEEVDGGYLVPPGAQVVSGLCRYHSDCAQPLACLGGVCLPECREDRDCAVGFSCLGGRCAVPAADGGFDGGARCIYSSDCELPLVCRSGFCVPECRQDRDCAAGFSCLSSRCLPTPPGGPDASVPSGYGQPCTLTSQCAPQLDCRNGACVFECVTARDCNPGLVECCVANRCARGPVCSGGLLDAGLLPDGGARDAGVRCRNALDCDDGQFCNGAETCVLGVCLQATRGVCDDGNPCSTDLCNESARTCAYQSIGPQDVDGDGRYAASCGMGADDCDDSDPTIYAGALERCDLKDNNCNGRVDENVWQEQPGARQVLLPSPHYGFAAGPAFVMQDGGFVELIVAADESNGTFDYLTLDAPTMTVNSSPRSLFGSLTAWDYCSGGYGKRVFTPRVFESPTQRFVSGVTVEADGPAAGCCSGGAGGYWRIRLQGHLYDRGFGTSAASWRWAWTGSGMTGYNGCPDHASPNGASLFNQNSSQLAAVWVPQRAHWRLFWADNRHTLFTETLGVDAGVGVQPLLATPFTSRHSGSSVRGVLADTTPEGVLVVWDQDDTLAVTTPHLEVALFDFDLNAPLWGPVALNAAPSAPLELWRDGADFVLAYTSNSQLWLQRLRPAARAVAPRALVGDAVSSRELRQRLHPAVARWNGGLALAVRNGATLTFGSARWDLDGGVSSVDVPWDSPPGSPPVLVPIDTRRVGLVWAESRDGGAGPLMRTVMECGP